MILINIAPGGRALTFGANTMCGGGEKGLDTHPLYYSAKGVESTIAASWLFASAYDDYYRI